MNLMKLFVSKLSFWGFAASLLTAVSFGANPPASEETSESVEETVTQAPSAGKLIGSVEVRPSWVPNFGKKLYNSEFHTENSIALGYKFDSSTSVLVRQEFNTNISNPTNSSLGLNPIAQDLIALGKFDNIWSDKSAGMAFSYEPRIYFPTDADFRDAGGLGATRQYLKLTKVFSDTFSMTAMEVPIVYLNQRAGTTDSSGKDTANPIFQNRVYLVGDLNFTKDLSLSIPVIWNGTRFGQFGNAAFSDTWHHKLWTYPELSYNVIENASVGLAYMSENFFQYDSNGVFQGLNLKAGYEQGMFQAVLRASL